MSDRSRKLSEAFEAYIQLKRRQLHHKNAGKFLNEVEENYQRFLLKYMRLDTQEVRTIYYEEVALRLRRGGFKNRLTDDMRDVCIKALEDLLKLYRM